MSFLWKPFADLLIQTHTHLSTGICLRKAARLCSTMGTPISTHGKLLLQPPRFITSPVTPHPANKGSEAETGGEIQMWERFKSASILVCLRETQSLPPRRLTDSDLSPPGQPPCCLACWSTSPVSLLLPWLETKMLVLQGSPHPLGM